MASTTLGTFTDSGGCPHMSNYWMTSLLNRPVGTTKPHAYTGTYALLTAKGMPEGERIVLPPVTVPKNYLGRPKKTIVPHDTKHFSPSVPVSFFAKDFRHTSRATNAQRSTLSQCPDYYHAKLEDKMDRSAATEADVQMCPAIAQEGEGKTFTYLQCRKTQGLTEQDDARQNSQIFWHPSRVGGGPERYGDLGKNSIVQQTFYRKNMAGTRSMLQTAK